MIGTSNLWRQNKQAMEACIQKKGRVNQSTRKKHPNVVLAQKKVEEASQNYNLTESTEDGELLNAEAASLRYLKLEE